MLAAGRGPVPAAVADDAEPDDAGERAGGRGGGGKGNRGKGERKEAVRVTSSTRVLAAGFGSLSAADAADAKQDDAGEGEGKEAGGGG